MSRDQLSPNGDGRADTTAVAVGVSVDVPIDVDWWIQTPQAVKTDVQGSAVGLVPNGNFTVTLTYTVLA